MTPRVRWCLLSIGAMTALEAQALAAERRASLTATGGISAAVNPYLSTSDVAKVLMAEMTLNPVLTSRTAVSNVELSATLGYRRYTGGLGTSLYGSTVLNGSLRKSERLSLNGSAFYRYENTAEIVDELVSPTDSKSVRRSVGATGSLQWRVSEHKVLAPSFSVQKVSYSGDRVLTGYNSLSGGLAFNRKLNPFTTIGVRGNGQLYLPDRGSTSNALALTATITHQLSSLINLEGGVGLQRIVGGRDDLTGRGAGARIYPAANVSMCRRGQWTSLCLTGAIAAEPTSRGSLERRMSAGISYAHRLSEASNLSLSAGYQRTSANDVDGLAFRQAAIASFDARASFDHKINRALSLGTFLNYRRRDGLGSAEGGSGGLNLRWMTGRH